jgi:hypothetical protein
MDLTPHNQLQQWLILALGRMGGSASRAEALARIEATFGLYFTADDLDSPPSRPFETKWRNRVSWQRDRMVKDGLLLPFEGYGTPWRLSDDGRREYEALRHESSLDDPLVNFRPKDSSDYIAHVEGRELIKRRSHEALIADFGAWCASLGFEVDTTVHPRDLVLRRPGEEWLVEAKVLYMGNATGAVRAALAQVLIYRFFLYQRHRPRLLALFSEPVGDAYVAFLDSHDVASVWRADDDRWWASSTAVAFESGSGGLKAKRRSDG